jgi:hypothetical protein
MSDTETTEEAAPAEAEVKKSKKHDLPEGWVTPSGLVHVLKERNIVEMAPQQVYGYCYHGKDFPTKNHTDGRYIVPVDDEAAAADPDVPGEIGAVSWIQNQLKRAAERKAAKAAKAQAAAAEATQPEAGGETVATSTEEAEEQPEEF